MSHIHAYLTFPGTTREAMTFYQACLGGELRFQPVGSSDEIGPLPGQIKLSIVHATLTQKNFVLVASDMVGDGGLMHGNNISLLLLCESESQIQDYFQKLSSDGRPEQPIAQTAWGALFGSLTDKYGNHWLLHFQVST